MPVICFEGASAVGKTTTAQAFKEFDGAFVVPEVNQLFARSVNEPVEWYFERQVDRWQIAAKENQNYPLVILDGDPFQPLWYNWAYDFVGWQNLEFMERFYKSAMRAKMIELPPLYFIFSASEAELRKRRASDAARQRRGFETHLRMIAPQRRYFEAMRALSPARVHFLETETIESNVEFIRRNTADRQPPENGESEFLLNEMLEWLRENKA